MRKNNGQQQSEAVSSMDKEASRNNHSSQSRDPSLESLSTSQRGTAVSLSTPKSNNHHIADEVVAEKESKKSKKDEYPKREDGSEYPRGIKLCIIIVGLCSAVFLMALDNAVIATAITKITDDFGSITDVGWYGSAYLLTTSSLQLLFGKFYTIWGVKWVYLTSIAIFEVGSAICGSAPNSIALIIGRAIAGTGSSGIFAGSLITLSHSLPLHRRSTYGSIVGAMYGIASITGPVLGGALTDHVSWRWCFYINLPLGAAVMAAIIFIFPNFQPSAPKPETLGQWFRRLDPIGTILCLPAVVCLLLALKYGGAEYGWNDGRVIALLVLFGVLILGFAAIQFWLKDNGTVPPRIISKRTVWAGCVFGFSSGSTFFLMIYYVPLWFQAAQGVTPVQSGVRILPMMISLIVTSLTVGRLVQRFGYYTPFMLVSTVGMSVGAGLISTWTTETATQNWIGYQILFGATYAMGSQQGLIAVQTVLDMKDIPIGTACIIFLTTLGGAIFVSVGQAIFSNSLIANLRRDAPSLDPYEVLNIGATNIRLHVDRDLLPAVIQAYSHAITRTFLAAACMAAVGIIGSGLMPWHSVKKKVVVSDPDPEKAEPLEEKEGNNAADAISDDSPKA